MFLGDGPNAQEPRRRFESVGCDVVLAPSLGEALRALDLTPARLIVVLEGAEPGRRTHEACRALREFDPAPMLVLGHAFDEAGRLDALEAGADDCLPFDVSERELLTHAGALFRRAPAFRSRQLKYGALWLDLTRQTAELGGRQVELTPYEFSLLRVLAEREGQPLSRDELMAHAKGSLDESFDRSIDVHICRLRRKLGEMSAHVRTIRGVGYMFRA